MSKKNRPPKEQFKKQTDSVKSIHFSSQKTDSKSVNSNSKTFDLKNYIAIAVILLITYLSFSTVKNYDFVNWDDEKYFYENAQITSLNEENFWQSTKEMFKTSVIGGYTPLTTFSFALDYKFRGNEPYSGLSNPGGWHMTNVWLHLLAVLFAFLIAKELGLNTIASSFVAILFAIHPMHVESVAWVTERKDVLYGSLFLISIFTYLKFKKNGNYFILAISYLCFILSLFSKIQAVVLPICLVLTDYYLDKKINLRAITTKIPFFLLSIIVGLYGISVLSGTISDSYSNTNYTFIDRLFIGSYSYCIYLIKLIIPFRLSPLYPFPNQIESYFYPTILIVPIVIWMLIRAYKKQQYSLVFSIVFFTINVIFLLQIVGSGQGFIADRYTYISYFGLFFGFGYILQKYWLIPKYKVITGSISAFFIVFLLFTTIKQLPIWQNSATLWTHVLKYYDKITTPYGNRANYYRSQKQYNLAINDYASAIALKPEPQTLNSRSKLYFDISGNSIDTLNMALADLNRAIELKPNDGEFLINRGAMYAKLGDFDKSLASLNEGLKIKPDQISGYLNRSLIYNMRNEHENAIKDFDEYLKYDPYKANIIFERGVQKRKLNKYDESILDYNRAIELGDEVNIGLFYYERAVSFYLLKNIPKAKADFQKAISLGFKNIDPNFKSAIEK